METIEGHIDDRLRPLIRIRVVGLEDSLLALVDTGFSGSILIPIQYAKDAELDIYDAQIWVTLALDDKSKVLVCDGVIEWFDKRIEVEMLVKLEKRRSQTKSQGTSQERPRDQKRFERKPDDHVLVVGVKLLESCRLSIDFPQRKVAIWAT